MPGQPDTVIIDGYNLIKRVPDLANRLVGADGLNAARSYLLGSLRAYQAQRGRRVVLVLDGPRSGRSDFGPVEVLYAVDADAAVVAQAGHHCLVVSSDSAVRQGSLARGADVLGSEDFWQALVVARTPRRASRPARRGATGGAAYEDDAGDEEADGPAKPTKGNPRRRPKSEKRRAQARADLMRKVQ